MKLMNLTINWFDFVVLGVLIAGVVHGRKRGMSAELLDVCQWLSIVVVSALFYRPVGNYVAEFTNLTFLSSYLFAYLLLALSIKLFFVVLRKGVGEKLVGSDLFGGTEYYLGMAGGAVRYGCILLFALALLNAKQITKDELAAVEKLQKENFGDISFPTLGTIQRGIFQNSASGVFIERYLDGQLIAATPPDTRASAREGIGRSRERTVEEALGKSL